MHCALLNLLNYFSVLLLVANRLVAQEVAVYTYLIWITHLLTLNIREFHAQLLRFALVNLTR